MASYMAPNGSCFMITWIIFKNHLLGGMPNTKLGDHGTPNADDCWFILLYHVWRPAWMEIHWNSIRLRARSHMTSHYTRGSVTTLHDFGGVLGWPWDTFFWAVTISSLTQNWETMALRTLTIADLFYFITCDDPHEWKSIEIAFGWGPGHIWLHTTLHSRLRDHATWFWRCVGVALGHFLLGCHNFMVTALGSCVTWP